MPRAAVNSAATPRTDTNTCRDERSLRNASIPFGIIVMPLPESRIWCSLALCHESVTTALIFLTGIAPGIVVASSVDRQRPIMTDSLWLSSSESRVDRIGKQIHLDEKRATLISGPQQMSIGGTATTHPGTRGR